MVTHYAVMFTALPGGRRIDFSEEVRTACNWKPGAVTSIGWLPDRIKEWLATRITTDTSKVTCRNCRRYFS